MNKINNGFIIKTFAETLLIEGINLGKLRGRPKIFQGWRKRIGSRGRPARLVAKADKNKTPIVGPSEIPKGDRKTAEAFKKINNYKIETGEWCKRTGLSHEVLFNRTTFFERRLVFGNKKQRAAILAMLGNIDLPETDKQGLTELAQKVDELEKSRQMAGIREFIENFETNVEAETSERGITDLYNMEKNKIHWVFVGLLIAPTTKGLARVRGENRKSN